MKTFVRIHAAQREQALLLSYADDGLWERVEVLWRVVGGGGIILGGDGTEVYLLLARLWNFRRPETSENLPWKLFSLSQLAECVDSSA